MKKSSWHRSIYLSQAIDRSGKPGQGTVRWPPEQQRPPKMLFAAENKAGGRAALAVATRKTLLCASSGKYALLACRPARALTVEAARQSGLPAFSLQW